jgi:transposase
MSGGAPAIASPPRDSGCGVRNSKIMAVTSQSAPNAIAKSCLETLGGRASTTIDVRSHSETNIADTSSRRTAHSPMRQFSTLRAIATRYDKLARNFLAGVHLASAIILLN